MIYNLPFRPIKGQSFRAYVSLEGVSDYSGGSPRPMWWAGTFASAAWTITKDAGTPASLTNAPVLVDNSIGYVDLTASEMNANIITISGFYATNVGAVQGYIGGIIIYTTSSELSAAPTINSSLADKITAIFQYLFLKRTVTATQEKLIKSDGSTVLGTGTLSDDGTTFSKGSIS